MKKFSIFNFQFSKKNRGFTLIELLVVVMIIGVLSTLGIVNYMDARLRVRDSVRKSNLHEMQFALQLYKADQTTYPATLPACGNPLRDPTNSTTYLQKIPCDPNNITPYTYRYTTTGSTYTISSCLENIRDRDKDTTNVAPCNSTSNWSYTVTNP